MIEASGRELRDDFAASVGIRTWQRGLADVSAAPLDDTTRVIGFGLALTEFMIAPLGLNAGARSAVARLGALANLIVTVYDSFVDNGHEPDELLPREWLSAAARGGRRINVRHYAPSARNRLVARLVTMYFAEMNELRYAQQHTRVTAAVVRAVRMMYEAERATLERLDRRSQRQKAALPFVVMALPAWLARSDAPPTESFGHLRWSWRVGAFFGTIDDVVDLSVDSHQGYPNLIGQTLHQLPPEIIARRSAVEGAAIIRDWRAALIDREAPSQLASNAFRTCLASWLGGAGTL
jgi:hypothetical protein